MKHYIILFFLSPVAFYAQTFSGNLADHGGQTVTLSGFDYYDTVALAQTSIDSSGQFNLTYPKDYKGMALLKTQDNSSLVVLLSGENIAIEGTHLSETSALKLSQGSNKTFFDYAVAQEQRKNALNAWKYLQKLYGASDALAAQPNPRNAIAAEIERLYAQERSQKEGLGQDSYLRWFVPYRSFIQDMPVIIRTETARIPESIALFRNTDFNHPYWKTSGILAEFIEKHYFMLENSSGSIPEKQEKMNQSSAYLLNNLQHNPVLLDKVMAKLFTLLEERSLYLASEFLANQALNSAQCEIQEITANKMEKYRNLKVGHQAPDIQLSADQKLSDYQQPLLLVFGKSDCPYCKEGALELLKYYNAWQTEKNMEVVYISLDTDEAAYQQAYQHAPWKMFCDFKGWDGNAAKDYHIWGTPSYFLLDKDLTILAHINSVAHANAWIQSRLGNGLMTERNNYELSDS